MEHVELKHLTSKDDSGGKPPSSSSNGQFGGGSRAGKTQSLLEEDFLLINKMYRNRLWGKRDFFLKHLNLDSDVATKLLENGILTKDEKNAVVSKATRIQQKQALFDLILKTKFKDIDQIIDACDENSNPDVKLMLETMKLIISQENPMDADMAEAKAGAIFKGGRPGSMPLPTTISFDSIILIQEPKTGSKREISIQRIIKDGEIADLKKLLKSVPNLDELVGLDDKTGQTSLHACILRGNDVMKYMEAVLNKFKKIEALRENESRKDEATQDTKSGSPRIRYFSQFVDHKDKNGQTAVHLAAEASLVTVVKELYRTYGSDIFVEDISGVSPLEIMYMKAPEAVINILDLSIPTTRNKPSDGNFKVEIDFKPVIGVSPGDWTNYSETALLANLINQNNESSKIILPHIIVKLFLAFKWTQMQYWIYLSIISHILLHFWYTVFIAQVFLIECRYDNSSSVVASQITYPSSGEKVEPRSIWYYLFENWEPAVQKSYSKECNLNGFWTAQGGVLIFFGIMLILKEVCEFWLKFRVAAQRTNMGFFKKITNASTSYFLNIENIFQLAVGCLMIFVCSVIFKNEITDFHYAFTSVSLMMTWSLILLQLGNISGLGIYVQILVKVVKRFLTLAMVYVVIIIAFSVSLSVIFPDEKPFRTLPRAFAKVLVMMTGELEYISSFYDTDSTWDTPVPFTGHFIYGCLAIVLTIVLMNLLVGMVVSDVGTLKEESEFVLLKLKVDQLSMVENSLIRMQWMVRVVQCLFGICLGKCFEVGKSGLFDIYIISPSIGAFQPTDQHLHDNKISPSSKATCWKEIREVPSELRKLLKEFVVAVNDETT